MANGTNGVKLKTLPNVQIPENFIKINPFVNDKKPVEQDLLSFVSQGLNFDENVVQKLCPSAISFSHFDGRSLYAAQEEILPLARSPRRLEPINVSLLSQVRRETSRRMIEQKPIEIEPKKFQPKKSLFFLTETKEENSMNQFVEESLASTNRTESSSRTNGNEVGPRRFHDSLERKAQRLAEKSFAEMERNWDKYMFEHMDENTAKFIILRHVHDEDRRARLIDYLKKTYRITKLPNPQEIELIPILDEEEEKRKATAALKKKKNEEKQQVEEEINKRDIPLYRLPRGVRRRVKEGRRDDASLSSRSNQDFNLAESKIQFPPKFPEVMSQKILSTFYRTEHPYEQEMLMGRNVHKPTKTPGVIVLSDRLQFNKVLQKRVPPDPDSIGSTLEIDGSAAFDRDKPSRGFRRWKALPGIRETDPHLQKPLSDRSINRAAAIRAFFEQNPAQPPDVLDISLGWLSTLTPDAKLHQILKTNTTVSRIVEEWRRKWLVGSQWLDADIEELYNDLHDIHGHVRFTAIVVCSRSAQYLTQEEIDLGLKVHLLPEKLIQAIEELLEDPQERIRIAASIALVTLRRFSPKIEQILRQCVHDGHPDDKLIAAQCLANVNVATSDIIHEILKNYFDADDELTREQLILALAKISQRTNLVHSLTGEYLNSGDAGDRLVACKLFPLLKSRPNKDITQKLIHLMWQDTNSSVRRVAGQALGKCGCGQAVHEEVVIRLQSSLWQDRVEALKLIGYLGVLTAKLMQPYLKCFKDDHVSVRDHACRTTYKLQLRDETIRNFLLECVQFDSSEKVRYSAVEALGLYGMTNEKCRSVLIWTVRYDKSPIVRAAAPAALVLLEKVSEEIIDTLQSRYLVEKELVVIQALKEALEAYHCNLSQEMPIVQEIRNEVRKLNTKNVIWQKITQLEKEMRLAAAMERLIAPIMDKPVTPVPVENEAHSTTTYSNYIQNVADSNLSRRDVLEVWTPERWHRDKRTGKMKKTPLPHENQFEEPKTNNEVQKETEVILPPVSTNISLLPVEEEEDELDENENGQHSIS